MRINPDSKAIAAWRYWSHAPRKPLSELSRLGPAAFFLPPIAGGIGALDSLSGVGGRALIDRA